MHSDLGRVWGTIFDSTMIEDNFSFAQFAVPFDQFQCHIKLFIIDSYSNNSKKSSRAKFKCSLFCYHVAK